MSDLTIKQGDTLLRTLTITDRDGSPANLTGATITLHVRLLTGSTDVLTVALTTEDAEAGLAQLRLTPVQTAALEAYRGYRYEVEIIDAASNVWTPVEGRLFVTPDRG